MFLRNLFKPLLPQTGLLFYPYYYLLVFLAFFMLYVISALSTLFCTQFSPQNVGSGILRLWNFKSVWASMPPNPPRCTGLTASCWYSRLLYIQTGLLLKLLLKSVNYATRRSSGPPCTTQWSVAEEQLNALVLNLQNNRLSLVIILN